jgi:hypothetical protein
VPEQPLRLVRRCRAELCRQSAIVVDHERWRLRPPGGLQLSHQRCASIYTYVVVTLPRSCTFIAGMGTAEACAEVESGFGDRSRRDSVSANQCQCESQGCEYIPPGSPSLCLQLRLDPPMPLVSYSGVAVACPLIVAGGSHPRQRCADLLLDLLPELGERERGVVAELAECSPVWLCRCAMCACLAWFELTVTVTHPYTDTGEAAEGWRVAQLCPLQCQFAPSERCPPSSSRDPSAAKAFDCHEGRPDACGVGGGDGSSCVAELLAAAWEHCPQACAAACQQVRTVRTYGTYK